MAKDTDAKQNSRRHEKVTLKDVATAAGVSMMTVSNVIHNRAYVREEMRQKVQDKIRELGYVPNRAAQQLAGVFRPKFGLLYPNVTNPFISSVIVGTMKAASDLESDVSIQLAMPKEDHKIKDIFARMIDAGTNGFLLPSPIAETVTRAYKGEPLPVPAVAIAPGEALPGLLSVRADERTAAFKLVSTLIDYGHRRIGHIAGPETQSASKARYEGYVQALEAHGIDPQPEWVVKSSFNFREGVQAAEKLLRADPRVTAIFAANDTLGSAVLAAAHKIGLHVPHELSVAGYDDSPIAEQVWPELTTVRQNPGEMTERAVRLLHAAVKVRQQGGQSEPEEDVVFPSEIIIRPSLSIAPANK